MGDNQNNNLWELLLELNTETTSIYEGLNNIINKMNKKLKEEPLVNEEKLNSYLESLQNKMEEKINIIAESIKNDIQSVIPELSKSLSEIQMSIKQNMSPDTDTYKKDTDNLKIVFDNITSHITQDSSNIKCRISDLLANIKLDDLNFTGYNTKIIRKVKNSDPENLKLEGITGTLSLTTYDGRSIETNVFFKSVETDISKILSTIEDHMTYGIKANVQKDTSMLLAMKLPRIDFNSISINSPDSKVKINGLNCSNLSINLEKGRVSISDVNCAILEVNTSKDKVTLYGGRCIKASIKTVNSNTIIDDCDINQCNVSNVSGRVNINLPNNISGTKEFVVTSSSEPVNICLPSNPDIYYNVDVFAFNGEIYINIPDITDSVNKQETYEGCHVIFETHNFETSKAKVYISVKSSDSIISIKQLNI